MLWWTHRGRRHKFIHTPLTHTYPIQSHLCLDIKGAQDVRERKNSQPLKQRRNQNQNNSHAALCRLWFCFAFHLLPSFPLVACMDLTSAHSSKPCFSVPLFRCCCLTALCGVCVDAMDPPLPRSRAPARRPRNENLLVGLGRRWPVIVLEEAGRNENQKAILSG